MAKKQNGFAVINLDDKTKKEIFDLSYIVIKLDEAQKLSKKEINNQSPSTYLSSKHNFEQFWFNINPDYKKKSFIKKYAEKKSDYLLPYFLDDISKMANELCEKNGKKKFVEYQLAETKPAELKTYNILIGMYKAYEKQLNKIETSFEDIIDRSEELSLDKKNIHVHLKTWERFTQINRPGIENNFLLQQMEKFYSDSLKDKYHSMKKFKVLIKDQHFQLFQ